MPKETLVDSIEMYDVTVGWSRGNYVQVGLRTHDGVPFVDRLSGGEGGEPAKFTELWCTLSDEAVDRLVTVLRRAQRQAYEMVE